MASVPKLIRATTSPHFKLALSVIRCALSSSDKCTCGSGDDDNKKGSDKKKDADEDPCLSCPSCEESNNPNAPTIYDSRKLGHKLSTDNVCPCFETLPNMPTGLFRCTTGEILGRGAGKCTYYQNPEYFSFHHMSFYDFNLALREYRQPCPKSGRKPI